MKKQLLLCTILLTISTGALASEAPRKDKRTHERETELAIVTVRTEDGKRTRLAIITIDTPDKERDEVRLLPLVQEKLENLLLMQQKTDDDIAQTMDVEESNL